MSFVHARGPLPVVKSNLNAPTAPIANRADATDFNQFRQALLDLAAFSENGVGLMVTEFGADPTGGIDSAGAINATLANGPGTKAVVPPGTYLINSQVTIPYGCSLQFLDGAYVQQSAPIILNENLSSLIGPHRGGVGFIRGQAPSSKAVLTWVGAPNSFMIGVCQALSSFGSSNIAPKVQGISCDANLIAGMTMLAVGGPAGCSPTWGIFSELAGYDFNIGIHAFGEQCSFREIHLNNQTTLGTYGVLNGDTNAAASVTHYYERLTIQNFTTGFRVGSGGVGGGLLVLRESVIEGFGTTGGIAIDIQGAHSGPYVIEDNYFEASDDASNTTTCFRIGSTGDTGGHIQILRNRIGGFAIPFEGISWDNLEVEGNTINGIPQTNPNRCRFKNTNSGLAGVAKRSGLVKDNAWENTDAPDLAGTETLGVRGMSEFERLNTNLDPVNHHPFRTLYRAPVTTSVDNTLTITSGTSVPIPTPLSFGATVWIVNASIGSCARFFLRAAEGARHVDGPYEDAGAVFSTTQGTAGKINVYWDAGTSSYRVENQLGGGFSQVHCFKYEEF